MSDRRAWEKPGVEEVTPSVFRIPLPLPGNVLRAVNVYALCGADGVALIDGGWFIPDALEQLQRGLAEVQRAITDVTTVLTTHYHPDHYTLAVELRRRTGCSVALGEGDRDTVAAMIEGDQGSDAFRSSLVRGGVPADFVERHLEMNASAHLYEFPDLWLRDGDRPSAGGRQLEAVATPGHTRGHFCFADDAAGQLFAGDHVLPHITPSIGYETVGAHEPLGAYLDSLRRVRERPDAVLLPAHGPVMPSVHARVDELLAHHDERLDRSVGAVATGACTAWEVAQRIPWTRHSRSLSDLGPFDQLMAVHETQAHLAVLAMQAQLTVTAGAVVDEYALT